MFALVGKEGSPVRTVRLSVSIRITIKVLILSRSATPSIRFNKKTTRNKSDRSAGQRLSKSMAGGYGLRVSTGLHGFAKRVNRVKLSPGFPVVNRGGQEST